MRHYDTVMAWVGLFLFNHGLATFSGQHVNQALLFPMEEVFEDFVADAFRRHQRVYGLRTQGPMKAFARIDKKGAFHMKPDLALHSLRRGAVRASMPNGRRKSTTTARTRGTASVKTTFTSYTVTAGGSDAARWR